MKWKRVTWALALVAVYTIFFAANLVRINTNRELGLDIPPYYSDTEYYVSFYNEKNPLKFLNDAENAMKGYQALYHELAQSPDYSYYVINEQGLRSTDAQRLFFGNSRIRLSPLQSGIPCVQVSENVLHDFNVKADKGALLTHDQFTFRKGEPIPVLLGHGYAGTYEVGDTFELEYLYYFYTFEVAGILAEGSDVNTLLAPTPLDQYIVMPSGDFTYAPQTKDETVSQLIHYGNQTCGKIKIPTENLDAARQYFEPILAREDMGEYSWSINANKLSFQWAGINLDRWLIWSSVASAAALAAALALTVPTVAKKKHSRVCVGKWLLTLAASNILGTAGAVLFLKEALYKYFITVNIRQNLLLSLGILILLLIYQLIAGKKQGGQPFGASKKIETAEEESV